MTVPCKRLAIMQPYFLPYIGYFQLMAAVDKFVVFDDVHYINRGWINRNRLLLNGAAHTFTLPLKGASQNKLISELHLHDEGPWKARLLRTFEQAYAKAPHFDTVFPLLERIINHPVSALSDYLVHSLRAVSDYLNLEVPIEATSRIYANEHLKGQARILDICRQESASVYINPIGGVALYDRESFSAQHIDLQFLQGRSTPYSQGKCSVAHVPALSIVDVLMFNDRDAAHQML